MSECDNYTFSFPSQPSGDGRFSILSHTLSLRNFSLWLLMSPGDWERNQVARDWRQRFILSCSHLQQRRLWHFANIVTIDPQRWYISTSEHRFHVSKWAVFNPCSTFFFFCYFVRFQAETVNITITCDLAQPSVENNFHAHLFRPSHKQEVPRWQVLALL